MKERGIRVYIGLMCAAAMVCLVFTRWSALGTLSVSSKLALGGLTLIALFSESVAIRMSVGASAGGASSIMFIPMLAGVQLFGPPAGVALASVTMLFGEFAIRRKAPMRGTFNVAQTIVAATVAGWAFTLLNGVGLDGQPSASISIGSQLWPFITFGLVFLALNHAAVSLAITLSQQLPFRRVWERMLSHSGGSLNDLLISPIALAVAFLYTQFELAGILILLLPMLFIRYSYLTTSRL